jgi:RNA polymerase sigma-70 factor (ECF subfamily)
MGPELRPHLESMDLVQDALIDAIRDLDRFTYSDNGDFLRWLSKIVENTIRDHADRLHAAKRDVRRQVSLNHEASTRFSSPVQHLPAVTTTPSVIFSLREDLDRLESAMDQLKPEYREVILLAKIEGFSCKEIAEQQGKSHAAVAMMLSRAIVSLTNLLEKI